jgi:molybdopterin synthase catalytic subunit
MIQALFQRGPKSLFYLPSAADKIVSMIQLIREVIDPATLTQQVRRTDCGAVVTFLGTVRDLTEDKVTIALDYEAYPAMAEKKMAEIEQEIRRRWPVGDMIMVHRLGRLEVGEVSVAVAVSCPHRGQAFEACRCAIDRLKDLVPIWKKENWADGSTEWIHPGLEKN